MAGIAYHPWYAVHGTKDFSDDKKWYETTVKVSSLYDCVTNAGTGNGRPDNKEANISYLSGQGGILCYSIPNANKPTYTHQEEVRRNLVDGYIENGVETYLYTVTSKNIINGDDIEYGFNGGTPTNPNLAENRTINSLGLTDAVGYHLQSNSYFKFNFTNENRFAYKVYPSSSGLQMNIGDTVIYLAKSPYLATAKNMLHTDIIGDPSPYNSSDAAYVSKESNDDTVALATGTLVWDVDTSKMYKTLDEDSTLDTDGIPSPAFTDTDHWTEVKKGYPQELRSLLASGKGIGFCSPLLVGQDGSDYIGMSNRTYSKKVADPSSLSELYSTDAGSSYTVGSVQLSDPINNRRGAIYDSSKSIGFDSYQAQNQSCIQIESPKPIKTVDKELIATNSHSIYAYNGLNYSATGKIATGSSIESKSVADVILQNAVVAPYYNISLIYNYVFTVLDSMNKWYGYTFIADVYPTSAGLGGWDLSIFNSKNIIDTDWIGDGSTKQLRILGTSFFTSIITTPKHNQPVNLDNQSITGSKALISQTENATQVFTQEISSGWDGTATFEDDVTTGLTIGTTYKETTTGGLYVAEADKITVSDTATWSYPAAYNDSGTFKQLTTGTTTDNSMNTIQTKVLLKASSIKV